jgi:hypothetical protein
MAEGRHEQWARPAEEPWPIQSTSIRELLIALILYRNGSYRTGYTVLLISSLLALAALTVARVVFPVPSRLEPGRSFDGTGQRIHARVTPWGIGGAKRSKAA